MTPTESLADYLCRCSSETASLLLDLRSAATSPAVSERAAWSLVRFMRLRSVRIGRCFRFDPAELCVLINAAKRSQAAATPVETPAGPKVLP